MDLLIRTSGCTRLSDFLLWQASTAHLAFVEAMWPDLTFWDFARCLLDFQRHAPALAKLRAAAASAGPGAGAAEAVAAASCGGTGAGAGAEAGWLQPGQAVEEEAAGQLQDHAQDGKQTEGCQGAIAAEPDACSSPPGIGRNLGAACSGSPSGCCSPGVMGSPGSSSVTSSGMASGDEQMLAEEQGGSGQGQQGPGQPASCTLQGDDEDVSAVLGLAHCPGLAGGSLVGGKAGAQAAAGGGLGRRTGEHSGRQGRVSDFVQELDQRHKAWIQAHVGL